MNNFIRSLAIVTVLLLLGMMTVVAQEVTYSSGPAISIPAAGNNGGFAWGDVNGDGYLDVLFRQNNLMINGVVSFSQLTTANLPVGLDAIGMAFADFDGDGRVDVLEMTQGTWLPVILLDSAGVTFKPMTSAGDLTSNALGSFNNFGASAAADIDHSGYLSLAWAGGPIPANNSNSAPASGIWLLKGGASGFTNAGRNSAPGNLAIDTMLSYEAWDVRFLDATNDGYPDLLMPSFRNGISKIDTGSSGSRKGCVLFVNDGTGKFIVPDASTLSRSIFSLDTAGVYVPILGLDTIIVGVDTTIVLDTTGWRDSLYIVGSTKVDTGIIVDDTVRHFAAIGETWGDINNDGNEDLVLNGLNATDNYNGLGAYVADVILYGLGDGTFTYKWDGVNVVANNGLTQNTAQRSLCIGDYNNDGLPDIFSMHTFGPQHMHRNNGDGTFTDMATSIGMATSGARSGQLVDYNNDGFLDIFQYTGTSNLLQRNGGNSNHWVGFSPVGVGNNKSAIGARLTVYTGLTKRIRDIKAEAVSSGMGGGLNAVFGLGTSTAIDSVVVNWPDGTVQKYDYIEIDKYYKLVEGEVIPDVPALVSPADLATGQPLALTLTWNTSANAVAYQVQVSLDPTFATNVIANDSALAGTSQDIADLGGSSVYYWRVRGLGAGSRLWSPWSTPYSFTTQNVTPGAITLIAPASNSVQGSNVTFVVSKSVGAAQYHWQISDDPAFGSYVVNDSTTDTTRVIGPLTAGMKFYWQVAGINPGGSGPMAGPDSFSVIIAPGTPTLIYPASNAIDMRADTLVLRWSSVPTASDYICEISLSPSMSPLVFVNDSTSDTTFTATGLTSLTKYYWRTLAFNLGGASSYTAIDSFTTWSPIPNPPGLSLPASGASGVSRTPTFVWRTSTYALHYRIQVATDAPFTNVVYDTTVADTTVTVPPEKILNGSTIFRWHVNANNNAGASAYSASRIFTTTIGVKDDELASIPKVFAMHQNYPNPFNPLTTISYDIPKNANVKLVIYDMLGRSVATLVDGIQPANKYTVQWDASQFGSGIYFYRIEARSQDGSENFTSVKKLVLMK